MRDFNFNQDENTSAANIAGVRPQEAPPETLILEETPRDENPPSSLSSFHVEQDEEAGNLPRIAGAVMVGLLIVGAGIYAYESHMIAKPAVKMAALTTTAAPAGMAASTPSQPAPEITPPAATPPVKSASQTSAPQAPEQTAPEQTAPEQTAAKTPTPGVGIGPTNDPAIDAPMSFTADNAPPPQQPGSSVQTATANQPATLALQQPITAPDVGSASQPTASVANNQTAPRQVQPAIQPPQ